MLIAILGWSVSPKHGPRQWYEELGGEVVLLGKPAAVLYEEALRMLNLRKDEVLAIGDSLQHDIAGAAPCCAGGASRTRNVGQRTQGDTAQTTGTGPVMHRWVQ